MEANKTVFDMVADIGGTNARFACSANDNSKLLHIQTLLCLEYPNIQDAIEAYLKQLDPEITIKRMCLAVAGPIENDFIDLPNNHWSFSRRTLEKNLGIELVLINDFTAQLMCAIKLDDNELQWLGEARPKPDLVLAALGPGTGLGVAGIAPSGEIIPSEGGHLAFAPTTPHEVKLLEFLWEEFPRVSVERILSGSGLVHLYQANSYLSGDSSTVKANIQAHEITSAAFNGDTIALASIQDFVSILGSVAGEVAIALGARGGIYLMGGILPRIEGLYSTSLLRERFNAKGRFSTYCSEIPLALVLAEHAGLKGCQNTLKRD